MAADTISELKALRDRARARHEKFCLKAADAERQVRALDDSIELLMKAAPVDHPAEEAPTEAEPEPSPEPQPEEHPETEEEPEPESEEEPALGEDDKLDEEPEPDDEFVPDDEAPIEDESEPEPGGPLEPAPEPHAAPQYTIRDGHPRILLAAEREADLQQRIAAAPAIWKAVIAAAERLEPGKSPAQHAERMLCAAAIWRLGPVPGFSYGKSREQYGEAATQDLLVLKDERIFAGQDDLGAIGPVAIAYDWLYDRLDDAQRAEIREKIAASIVRHDNSRNLDQAWNCYNQWDGNGMIGALAIHGETDFDWVDLYYRENWFGDRPKAQNYALAKAWYTDGGYTEGFTYVARLWSNFVTRGGWITATDPADPSLDFGIFTSYPLWILHRVRPVTATSRRQGLWDTPVYSYAGMKMSARSYYWQLAASTSLPDPNAAAIARWLLDISVGYDSLAKNPGEGLLFGLLIGDPRVKGRSPEELRLPLSFTMVKPGEHHDRNGWGLDATHVSFACQWKRNRVKMSGDVMVFSRGKVLTGNRDSIYRHHYGEPWFRNCVLFYEGPELRHAPDSLYGGVDGRFEVKTESAAGAEGAGERTLYVGELGKTYRTPEVKLVRRTFHYDRPANVVTVVDEIECALHLAPRICWNMPLAPRVEGDRITLINGPAGATMTFDVPPAEIKVVGGPENNDFARGYDCQVPDRGDPQHIKKQYGAFLGLSEADRADAGGFYTIFVTPAGNGGTYRLTTTIEVL